MPQPLVIIPPAAWLNSHLSTARHYGGCKINGHVFFIVDEGDLVREDYIEAYLTLGRATFLRILQSGIADITPQRILEHYATKKKKNRRNKPHKASARPGESIIPSRQTAEISHHAGDTAAPASARAEAPASDCPQPSHVDTDQ